MQLFGYIIVIITDYSSHRVNHRPLLTRRFYLSMYSSLILRMWVIKGTAYS
jgi:hypothetical protein